MPKRMKQDGYRMANKGKSINMSVEKWWRNKKTSIANLKSLEEIRGLKQPNAKRNKVKSVNN